MPKKNPFPPEEGWLTMKLTMTTKKPRSEEELKRIGSFGKPDAYEWGVVEQYGNKVVLVMREKKEPAPASHVDEG
ncbi:hypothetical protein AYO49_05470 [Verrucomicrobiaceae bacterium SCGC AG-212-N21]|nr:hypothetical protein AYO49_05470 [Verrucomicrobiaceae bacterium SCGC AG-212-N21]